MTRLTDEELEDYRRRLRAGDSVDKIEAELFRRLCEKSNKTECEPGYCFFRITGTCRYVDAMRRLKHK